MEKILTISDGKLVSGGTMMMIGSFTIGTLLGEWMNIEQKMEQFGEWLKAKTGNAKDNLFVEGCFDFKIARTLNELELLLKEC